MLVDIQISLSSIMLENKQFKKELYELKAFPQLSNNELHEMKTRLDEAAKANIKSKKTKSMQQPLRLSLQGRICNNRQKR